MIWLFGFSVSRARGKKKAMKNEKLKAIYLPHPVVCRHRRLAEPMLVDRGRAHNAKCPTVVRDECHIHPDRAPVSSKRRQVDWH